MSSSSNLRACRRVNIMQQKMLDTKLSKHLVDIKALLGGGGGVGGGRIVGGVARRPSTESRGPPADGGGGGEEGVPAVNGSTRQVGG